MLYPLKLYYSPQVEKNTMTYTVCTKLKVRPRPRKQVPENFDFDTSLDGRSQLTHFFVFWAFVSFSSSTKTKYLLLPYIRRMRKYMDKREGLTKWRVNVVMTWRLMAAVNGGKSAGMTQNETMLSKTLFNRKVGIYLICELWRYKCSASLMAPYAAWFLFLPVFSFMILLTLHWEDLTDKVRFPRNIGECWCGSTVARKKPWGVLCEYTVRSVRDLGTLTVEKIREVEPPR